MDVLSYLEKRVRSMSNHQWMYEVKSRKKDKEKKKKKGKGKGKEKNRILINKDKIS